MQLFSIFLALGALTGLLLSGWRAPQKETTRYLDAGLGILFGALVGSRALAVAASWSYYQNHAREILLVWLGGLSGVGALFGGVVAIIVLALSLRLPAGILSDTFLPLAGTLAVTSWLGCWINGISYGASADTWWALPGRDEWGVIVDRVPVQLLGAILSLAVILLLEGVGKHLPIKGMSANLGLFGLSAVIFGLSFLRIDPALTVYGLRLEAWGAMFLMLISALFVVVLLMRWILRRRVSPAG